MNPLTTDDFLRLAPGESVQTNIGWPFKPNGFRRAGRYTIELTYDLASPDTRSWQMSGRLSKGTSTREIKGLLRKVPCSTVTSPLFEIEVRQLEKSMVEQAIIDYFHPSDLTFAFVEEDYVNNKWEVADIRQSMGCISSVVQFNSGYVPPMRPEYVTAGYWLEKGRYLFIPQYGNRKELAGSGRIVISKRFKIHVPKEAKVLAQRHMSNDIAHELGFED